MLNGTHCRYYYTRLLGVFFMAVLPLGIVSAHETRSYVIGDDTYEITLGSLNEPVFVDMVTGFDLGISKNDKPYQGAAETLQVELIASGASRVRDLTPNSGEAGRYHVRYIATTPVDIAYRLFGTLGETAFDVTYACQPLGHDTGIVSTSSVPISELVTETAVRGGFDCPRSRNIVSFPDVASSTTELTDGIDRVDARATELAEQVRTLSQTVVNMRERSKNTKDGFLAVSALIMSAVAVVVGVTALVSRRKRIDMPSSAQNTGAERRRDV